MRTATWTRYLTIMGAASLILARSAGQTDSGDDEALPGSAGHPTSTMEPSVTAGSPSSTSNEVLGSVPPQETEDTDKSGDETKDRTPVISSPLATWDANGTQAVFFTGDYGTIDISGHCVHLLIENGRSSYLMVWPEPTSWDADTQTIQFVAPITGERIEFRHGDKVSAMGLVLVRGSELPEPEYVVPPHESCRGGSRIIAAVVRMEPD